MKRSRTNTLLFLLALGLLACQSESKVKPNVIYINVDDLGYGDVGCYGATKVKTPNIDLLSKQGKRFTDAHSASAVCSPSRYSAITGQYPTRGENLWLPIFADRPLVIDTNQLTIADVMKQAGYATAAIGKWHLGFGEKRPVDWNAPLTPGPLQLGFDYYFGVPILNSHPPFVYVENDRVLGWVEEDPILYYFQEGFDTAETMAYREKFDAHLLGGGKAAHALYRDTAIGTTIKNKAVDWIKAHKEEPFFLYLATTNIHHPFTPAKRFIGTSEAGMYGDFIHELDWIVGEVINTLKEEDLEENTIIIFTSDNGGMLNMGGQEAYALGHHQNSDLLGFKFDAWEGGHRIPFIVKWPGKVGKGTVSSQLICNVDILATLAALVGYPLKEEDGPDSYNILQAIVSDPKEAIRESLVICPSQEEAVSLRKGDWMFISTQGGGGFTGTEIGEHTLGGPAAHLLTKQHNSDIENGKLKVDAAPAQLYNLKDDATQKVNVYNQYPEVAEQMRTTLDSLLRSKRTAPR